MKHTLNLTYRAARRIAIALIGGSVVVLGIVMLVTPGPAFVVIPAGLALLGLEFAFARRWLSRIREQISNGSAALRASSIGRIRR